MNANKEIMAWDSQSADVLITREAINKISCMIHRDPYHECGGTLIGNFSQDEKTKKYTVLVEDVYYEDQCGTAAGFEFDIDFKYAFTSVARSYLFRFSDNDIFKCLKLENHLISQFRYKRLNECS